LEDFRTQEVKKEKRKVQKILKPLLAKTGEKKAQVYLICFQMNGIRLMKISVLTFWGTIIANTDNSKI
jgi:hypothetical protein